MWRDNRRKQFDSAMLIALSAPDTPLQATNFATGRPATITIATRSGSYHCTTIMTTTTLYATGHGTLYRRGLTGQAMHG